jgi:hypothetical protein
MPCNYEINLEKKCHDSKSIDVEELHVNIHKIETRLKKQQSKIKYKKCPLVLFAVC